MLLRANEMRAKLRDISVDKIGTRRLLRAFPDMKSALPTPRRWPPPAPASAA